MDEKPPTLDYPPDESLRALRRGMRWMLALTLLNTVLLGTSVFAPGITAFAKAQWASFQAARAARAQAEAERVANLAMMAAQADAMRFALPPDTLVFSEDFAPNTLPLRGTTSTTLPATRRIADASTAAATAPMPEPLRALPRVLPGFGEVIRDIETYLLVHARRARPDSGERLVLFSVNNDTSRYSGERRLLAVVLEPAAADRPLRYRDYSAWDLGVPDAARPLRLFAARIDAADPSRWTIAYEWGNARGTLSARLAADDRVDLQVDGPLASKLKRSN